MHIQNKYRAESLFLPKLERFLNNLSNAFDLNSNKSIDFSLEFVSFHQLFSLLNNGGLK